MKKHIIRHLYTSALSRALGLPWLKTQIGSIYVFDFMWSISLLRLILSNNMVNHKTNSPYIYTFHSQVRSYVQLLLILVITSIFLEYTIFSCFLFIIIHCSIYEFILLILHSLILIVIIIFYFCFYNF